MYLVPPLCACGMVHGLRVLDQPQCLHALEDFAPPFALPGLGCPGVASQDGLIEDGGIGTPKGLVPLSDDDSLTKPAANCSFDHSTIHSFVHCSFIH